MSKGKLLTSLCILIAIFITSAAVPSYAYTDGQTYAQGTLTVLLASAPPQVKEFLVYVGRTGFNGSSAGLNIVVNEGDTVRIKFVYTDNDLNYDNPHQIMIEGYGITTGKIDRSNPEETVEFVAGQSGQFTFHCVLICNGHPFLQEGKLIVAPVAGTALPTKMTLSLDQAVGGGDGVGILVTLVDSIEKPVVGAIVQFYVNTTFGPMKVDSSTTNADGRASVTYSPKLSGQVQIIASYDGGARYAGSTTSGSITYQARTAEEPIQRLPFAFGQNTGLDVRLVGSPLSTGLFLGSLLGLVIGGVWATYLFVVKQLADIRKYGKVNRAQKPVRIIVAPQEPRLSIANIALATMGLVGLGVVDSVLLGLLQLSVVMKAAALATVVVIEVSLFLQLMKRFEGWTNE